MLAPYPVRLRSNSSPAHPPQLGGPSSPKPAAREPPLVIHPPKPKKLSLSILTDISPAPTPHASPLRLIRERLRRPSSAGGPTDRKKSPRPKGAKPRPSTSTGSPEPAKAISHHPQVLSEKYSMSNLRRKVSGHGRVLPGADLGDLQRKDSSRKNTSRINRSSIGSKAKPALVISHPKPAAVAPNDFLLSGWDDPRFSTADRMILHELKTKMQARDAQFKVKHGKKHHPYDLTEAPYPTNYDPGIIDNDIWEEMWSQRCSNDLTWHRIEEVPLRVLDLGCGSGSWILDCARHWKDTHFVGLDIVPLHPDLYQLGSSQMASRITWIQANFLERLPFQDEEFDFVHVKRIARGVPEDKWDGLFEEINRVMKPGGRLEMFEEELYFPGKPVYAKADELVDLDLSGSPPPSSHHPSSDSLSPVSSTSTHISSPLRTEPPFSFNMHGATMGHTPASSRSSLTTPSHTSVASRMGFGRTPLHRVTLPPTLEDDESSINSDQISASQKMAINPRDHSLLEFVYNEMHACRFINLEPLALLKYTIPLYFKETCLHPPVILTFPPRPESTPSSTPHTPSASSPLTPSEPPHLPQQQVKYDPNIPLISLLAEPNPHVIVDDERLKHLFASIKRSMSYARFSDVYQRFWKGDIDPILGPELLAAVRNLQATLSHKTHKPLSSVSFDFRTLNMHLSLKVHEVLACAEEMWEWVVQYQNALVPRTPRSGLVESVCARAQKHHEALRYMARSEFDDMLSRFELDMQEQIGLKYLVRDSLGWKGGMPSARTQARKDFDQLCAEWKLYEQSLKHPMPPPAPTHTDSWPATPRSAAMSLKDEYHREQEYTHSEGEDGPPTPYAGQFVLPKLPRLQRLSQSEPQRESRDREHERADGSTVPLSHLEPHERISRRWSIFVAWKEGRSGQ